MSGTNWVAYDGDYDTEYAETDDPRVLALIKRDPEPFAPYGDALAPAYFTDYNGYHGWAAERAGDVYHSGQSDEVADGYVRARDHFGDHDMAVRFLKIFHGVTDVRIASSSIWRGEREVLIFDSPDYRAHIGAGDEPMNLDGEEHEWNAYLDGDVYGVGYAVNMDRVDYTDDVDLCDFTEEIECWGYFGEEYAKEEALTFVPPLDQPLIPMGGAA